MTRRWTNEELSTKIDWEGGIYEALLWGITGDMVPEDLEIQWFALTYHFKEFHAAWEAISAQLPEPGGDLDA